MAWGHAQSQSSLSLAEWAGAMRTGMRLFENFELPAVHVVREGETVYSIARTWNVSPHCLSAKNDVWDDIQPGMTLAHSQSCSIDVSSSPRPWPQWGLIWLVFLASWWLIQTVSPEAPWNRHRERLKPLNAQPINP